MKENTVAILGAGSWGTAVAIHIAKQGYKVMLWARNPQHVLEMQSNRINSRYLPDIKFPETLIPSSDINSCVDNAGTTIIAVPSHAFADLLSLMKVPSNGIAWLTKGIDKNTNRLLSDVVAEHWGENLPAAIISGPSFASEVGQGLPTALVVAGNNIDYLNHLRNILHHQYLRVYTSRDIVGVQLCGAVKNVLAIACGVSDGMKFGANARAALITRGLAEMKRLGLALNAKPDTFMGLAGIGDLILTCTDDQSRNRRFGLMIGQKIAAKDAEEKIKQVIEGKHNAAQICSIAAKLQIQMPICQEINELLQGKINAKEALKNLMGRPPNDE